MIFAALLVLWTVLFAVGLVAFARWFLLGEDLSRFDGATGWQSDAPDPGAPGPAEVVDRIRAMRRDTETEPLARRLRRARELADEGFAGTPIDPAGLDVHCRAVEGKPAGEWIHADDAVPGRRLLYIHGGAFVLGSPASHRAITSALAHRTRASVFALDYRLMPEHHRLAAVSDCRTAYRWIVRNGPEGPGDAAELFVAGDSAGGNLALMLLAWARDAGVRRADAAVAFSPATDACYESPSLRANAASDVLLGPSLGRLMRTPRSVLAWFTLFSTLLPPRHPVLSPVRGSLHGLPPTLVQASTTEMLLDDARRYVNRAQDHGSVAELELWPDMVHVWQFFWHVLPEGEAALDRAAAFLERHAAARDRAESRVSPAA